MTTTTSTTGASSTGTTTAQQAVQLPSKTLGQDEFLKLLVTQLQYQDPLKPMDNEQFLSQMAQFSALQEMTAVSQSETDVVKTVQQLQLQSGIGSAYQLLGATVQGTDDSGNTVSGVVSGVKTVNGKVMVEVGQALLGLDTLQSVTK